MGRARAQIAADAASTKAVAPPRESIADEPGEQVDPARTRSHSGRRTGGRKKPRRAPTVRAIRGPDFRLAEEIRYIQRRAAERDGRFVTVGPLALFSTGTGDAWVLDPADHLAARLAQDGTPVPLSFEETLRVSMLSDGK